MKPFSALICKLKGHKRRKRINEPIARIADFQCPRCGHTQAQRVPIRKAKAGT